MPDKVEKITEQPSRFDHLEQMSVVELLRHINEEDCRVADAVRRAIPQIEALVWMPVSYHQHLVFPIRR